jgi:hypothetical protein
MLRKTMKFLRMPMSRPGIKKPFSEYKSEGLPHRPNGSEVTVHVVTYSGVNVARNGTKKRH